MSDLFRERVTRFLMRFVTVPEPCFDGEGRMFATSIRQALKVIVQGNTLTPKEVTDGLLACDVILPTHQINEWVEES